MYQLSLQMKGNIKSWSQVGSMPKPSNQQSEPRTCYLEQQSMILHVVSVGSASYLWTSWQLRMHKVLHINGVYAQDLKEKN